MSELDGKTGPLDREEWWFFHLVLIIVLYPIWASIFYLIYAQAIYNK